MVESFEIGKPMPSEYMRNLFGQLFTYSRVSSPFVVTNINNTENPIVIEYDYGRWHHYITTNEEGIINKITWDNGSKDAEFFINQQNVTLNRFVPHV